MAKINIFAITFFNTDIIHQSLNSLGLAKEESKHSCNITVLENLSPHSDEIAALIHNLFKKGYVNTHLRSTSNVSANIVTHAIKKEQVDLHCEYIAITETDVILDKGALDEAVSIMEENNFDLCSIDPHLRNLPLELFPDATSWVPYPTDCGSYLLGATGFQFILFRKEFLFKFLNALDNKYLNFPIALVDKPNYSLHDGNLFLFCQITGTPWPRTKKWGLRHIGWDLYANPDDKYVHYKNNLLEKGEIWTDDEDVSFSRLLG